MQELATDAIRSLLDSDRMQTHLYVLFDYGLTLRLFNKLEKSGIHTIEEVLRMLDEGKKLKGLGPSGLARIEEVLEDFANNNRIAYSEGRGKKDPDEAEIKERCEEIQKQWTKKERDRRRRWQIVEWDIPDMTRSERHRRDKSE